MVVETKTIKTKYGERVIILWMKNVKFHPFLAFLENPDDEIMYTCPDESRGAYYEGQTFISLLNKKNKKIINTVSLGEMDISRHIQKKYWDWYHSIKNLKGISGSNKNITPKHIWLIDFNGDGYTYEFAFFSQDSCSATNTRLVGYSIKQDKVIKYAVKIKYLEKGKTTIDLDYWADSLFMYRYKFKSTNEKKKIVVGQGDCVEKFTYTYSPKYEMFFGSLKMQECKDN